MLFLKRRQEIPISIYGLSQSYLKILIRFDSLLSHNQGNIMLQEGEFNRENIC